VSGDDGWVEAELEDGWENAAPMQRVDKRGPESVERWLVVRTPNVAALVELLPANYQLVFEATPLPDGRLDVVVEGVDVAGDTLERVERRLSMYGMLCREWGDRNRAFEAASAAMN